MASYTSNILPTDAAHYTLNNATLTNGVLTIGAGGSATCIIYESMLAALTETFRVNMIMSPAPSNYTPGAFMRILARSVDGACYNYTCVPTADSTGIYSVEIEMEAVEYDDLTVVIASDYACTVTLWELCPRASDTDVEVIIEGVKQSLPKLLYDYNTLPLSVGQHETTISLITCLLKQSTDLQGHLNLAYTASHTATITLRFKDGGATELFAPLLYDVHAGRGTIGVPHAYLKRLAGYHNFTITAQVSVGTLAIGIRGVMFTIDGGYLAARTIDIGANVSDFTIEQKAEDDEPRYIWIISVEAGELLVRRRAYSTDPTDGSFEPMFSLGPALDGAIEFDGDWALHPDDESAMYRLNTYDNPFCFIIDTDNKLYAQVGMDTASRQLLDTSVDSVSVCRGFKSNLYPEQDQGVIALYVKNGQAVYAQYAYNAVTQRYMWSTPAAVSQIVGTVVSASVHRLNDYRVGFAITTQTANYWLISSRTYVGQAFKPEIVDMGIKRNITTVGLLPDNMVALSATGELSTNRLQITATFNYPIRCLESNIRDLVVIPSGLSAIVDSVELYDEYTLIITCSSIVRDAYTITFNTAYAWQYYYNNSWLAFPTSTSFTYEVPTITYYGYESETVDMTVRSSSFTVSLRPIGTIQHSHYDTLTLDPTLQATVTQSAISNVGNQYNDTCQFDPQLTATVTLTQVSPQPV